MEHVLDEFIEHLRDEKQASVNTVLSYRRDLRKLCSYIQNNGMDKVQDLTPTTLTSFILSMEDAGFSPATISRTIASVKGFVAFCIKKGILKEDISVVLKAPKVEKKKKEALSSKEMFLLLEQPDESTSKGMRDKAMLELLCATGMRVTQLIALNMDDINLKLGYVRCGNKTMQIGREAQKAVAHYLEQGRSAFIKQEDTSLVFFNCAGSHMSRQGFWKMLKTYADKAGITSEITPHSIRNSLQ